MHRPPCFCGRAEPYPNCCGVFISGNAYPETPELLMRSRYSAYVQANIDYIAETMKGPAAEDFDKRRSKQWAESVTWVRLKVVAAESSADADTAYVEFIAIFREGGGTAEKIHERSEFHRVDDRWYYWDGESV